MGDAADVVRTVTGYLVPALVSIYGLSLLIRAGKPKSDAPPPSSERRFRVAGLIAAAALPAAIVLGPALSAWMGLGRPPPEAGAVARDALRQLDRLQSRPPLPAEGWDQHLAELTRLRVISEAEYVRLVSEFAASKKVTQPDTKQYDEARKHWEGVAEREQQGMRRVEADAARLGRMLVGALCGLPCVVVYLWPGSRPRAGSAPTRGGA